MSTVFEDREGPEYPFPIIDPVEPTSSPSDSLPSRSKSSRSKSPRSGSFASPHHSRGRVEHDREHTYAGNSAKFLSKLIYREERDLKHARSALALTTEKLENETRRADQAEQRVMDALHRLRDAHEATLLARSEAARANQELNMYKLQLQNAQQEIARAQEILNQVEQQRVDAEADAARARGAARKLREEKMISKAREQGKQEGFQEGFSRGKTMGFYEARSSEARSLERRYTPGRRPIFLEQFSDEDEDIINIDGSGSGSQDSSIPQEPIPSNRIPRPRSAPRLPSRSRRSETDHVPDVAPFAQTLPVPTVTTPIPISPSAGPRSSPNPVPVPDPTHRQHRREQDGWPTPIHNGVPSPMHPPVDIPPDNFIPYADENSVIALPPPHEFTQTVSPQPSVHQLPLSARGRYEQSVRARDYAYMDNAGPSSVIPPGVSLSVHTLTSPQSKASTRISQYDIVSPPREDHTGTGRIPNNTLDGYHTSPSPLPASALGYNIPRSQSRARENRPPMSPRGPRDRTIYSSTPFAGGASSDVGRRKENSSGRSPLGKLFKRMYHSRTSQDSGGIPEINVESPSTADRETRPSSPVTITQRHLLSPEHAQRILPITTPQNTLAPQSQTTQTHNTPIDRSLTPLPELGLSTPGILSLSDGQLPAGFVPFRIFPYAPSPSGSSDGIGTNHHAVRSPRGAPIYDTLPVMPNAAQSNSTNRYTPEAASGVALPSSSQNLTSSSHHRRLNIAARFSPRSLFT